MCSNANIQNVSVIYYVCMQKEWKAQQERYPTSNHKTVRVLRSSGTHLSHKGATVGRCLQRAVLWEGIRAKRTDMCFHALGERRRPEAT